MGCAPEERGPTGHANPPQPFARCARSSTHYRPDGSHGQDVLASDPLMASPTTIRTATLPALVYVLAASAVVPGSSGARRARAGGGFSAKPRGFYLQLAPPNNGGLRAFAAPADLEKYDAHEADARYGRR